MVKEKRVSMPEETHLRIENVALAFGNLVALHNVELELKKGEILGVIGPNGAGKTCLLNCISGFYKPQKGEILKEKIAEETRDEIKVNPLVTKVYLDGEE